MNTLRKITEMKLVERGYNAFEKFDNVLRLTMTQEGAIAEGIIRFTGNDFLCERIEIHAYSARHGNLFGANNSELPPDRFTAMISNNAGGNNYASQSVDIGVFSPHHPAEADIPILFNNATELTVKIQHERAVFKGTVAVDAVFPPLTEKTADAKAEDNYATFDVIFIGAKVRKD